MGDRMGLVHLGVGPGHQGNRRRGMDRHSPWVSLGAGSAWLVEGVPEGDAVGPWEWWASGHGSALAWCPLVEVGVPAGAVLEAVGPLAEALGQDLASVRGSGALGSAAGVVLLKVPGLA